METEKKQTVMKFEEKEEEKEESKTESPKELETTAEKPLSKNQLKKKRREAEYLKKREEKKAEKKVKEKEKKLQQKILREAKIPKEINKPVVQEMASLDLPCIVKKRKQDLVKEYKENLKKGIPIIIDLSFHEKMTEKEMKSLCNQVGYCHGINKRYEKPVRLTISSYNGKIKDRLVSLGADCWGAITHEDDYTAHYPKEDLVYLTGDAEHDMEHIDPSKIYIIGGMVDHNRLKKATYNKAQEEGIATQRFPLQKYMKLKSSTILAVNHVFEVLLRIANGENWEGALKNSIPKRKVLEWMSGKEEEEEEETLAEEEKDMEGQEASKPE